MRRDHEERFPSGSSAVDSFGLDADKKDDDVLQ
jgi:hypothetical protein